MIHLTTLDVEVRRFTGAGKEAGTMVVVAVAVTVAVLSLGAEMHLTLRTYPVSVFVCVSLIGSTEYLIMTIKMMYKFD